MDLPHDTRALGRAAGVLAIATAAVAIIFSIILGPFSIAEHSLSDLGAPGSPVSTLFNTGLIIAGLLGIVFGVVHAREQDSRVERAGSWLYVLTALALALIGGFPVGTDLHLPFSAAFFVLLTYALFVHGTGRVLAGEEREGLTSTWLGILHATAWTVWAFALRGHISIAGPELVGTAIISGWTLWQAGRMRDAAQD